MTGSEKRIVSFLAPRNSLLKYECAPGRATSLKNGPRGSTPRARALPTWPHELWSVENREPYSRPSESKCKRTSRLSS